MIFQFFQYFINDWNTPCAECNYQHTSDLTFLKHKKTATLQISDDSFSDYFVITVKAIHNPACNPRHNLHKQYHPQFGRLSYILPQLLKVPHETLELNLRASTIHKKGRNFYNYMIE